MSSSDISVKLYRENGGAQQPAALASALANTGLPRGQRAAITCHGFGLLASKTPQPSLPVNFELPLLFGDS